MITAEQERQLAELGARNPDHFMHKFCDWSEGWYYEATLIARYLGLEGCKPLNILDIGCGFGYFLAACSTLGHECIGLDVPDEVIARAAWALRVHLVPHAIVAYEPLPAKLTDYDLITTFGVNFRRADDSYWDEQEYTFLAADLRKRLRPGGRWLLRPNQTDDSNSPISFLRVPAWWREVVGPQATITVSTHEVEIRWQNA